mmetsp:Transcript_19025/g.40039  ORF Transcript_19025/g.40039 Transcript_19025/m.40039 type:complete len:233 (-) Transcript_19025:499-1197(-)
MRPFRRQRPACPVRGAFGRSGAPADAARGQPPFSAANTAVGAGRPGFRLASQRRAPPSVGRARQRASPVPPARVAAPGEQRRSVLVVIVVVTIIVRVLAVKGRLLVCMARRRRRRRREVVAQKPGRRRFKVVPSGLQRVGNVLLGEAELHQPLCRLLRVDHHDAVLPFAFAVFVVLARVDAVDLLQGQRFIDIWVALMFQEPIHGQLSVSSGDNQRLICAVCWETHVHELLQ